jgi:hypothetical protein
MISSLTPEQQTKIQEYYNFYLKKGLSTQPSNRQVAEKAIKEMYRLIKEKKEPTCLWVNSPTELITLAKDSSLYSSLDSSLPSSLYSSLYSSLFWGQCNSSWISFFKYCNEVLGIQYKDKEVEKLNLWIGMMECSYFFTFKSLVILMAHPKEIKVDGQKRTHCTTGYAITFYDNTGIYAIHGNNLTEKEFNDSTKLFEEKRIDNLEYIEMKAKQKELV